MTHKCPFTQVLSYTAEKSENILQFLRGLMPMTWWSSWATWSPSAHCWTEWCNFTIPDNRSNYCNVWCSLQLATLDIYLYILLNTLWYLYYCKPCATSHWTCSLHWSINWMNHTLLHFHGKCTNCITLSYIILAQNIALFQQPFYLFVVILRVTFNLKADLGVFINLVLSWPTI